MLLKLPANLSHALAFSISILAVNHKGELFLLHCGPACVAASKWERDDTLRFSLVYKFVRDASVISTIKAFTIT
jgi:predicted peroxiredoxin